MLESMLEVIYPEATSVDQDLWYVSSAAVFEIVNLVVVVVTGWVKPAVPGTRTRVGTGTGREFRTSSVGGRAEIAR